MSTPSQASRAALLGVFFLSGACALVYQVLWVRQLGLVFGTATRGMAVVLGAFMGGLALGSALASLLGDRVRKPLLAYSLAELVVSLSALAVPFLLAQTQRIFVRAVPIDAPLAASLGLQLVLCTAVLLLPTTAMGATLPLLSRQIARGAATRGRDLGTLYALNTLGSFVGAAVSGFWAIEHLGLARTLHLAAATNAALAAWALVASRGALPAPAPRAEGETPRAPALVLACACASGFLALGDEVIWTRLIGLAAYTTTYVYSTILVTVIGGLGVGGIVGARLSDRPRDPLRVFGLLQAAEGICAVAVFPAIVFAMERSSRLLALPFASQQLRLSLLCGALIAPACLFMGASFPFLLRALAAHQDKIGRSVGRLYAFNTAGAIGGSLVAGFVVLPSLGAVGAALAFAGGSLVVGLLLARQTPSASGRRLVAGLALAGFAASAFGASVSVEDLYRARLPRNAEILEIAEGSTSTVMVADVPVPKVRRIWIQSSWVAGTGGMHRLLGHLPMLHAESTDRVVGIAFGTGQSFASASLYSPSRVDCVDLDRGAVELGGRWFAEQNHHLLELPTTRVFIDDGRSFLGRVTEPYDAIVMEPLQPWSAGAVNLYTEEFYLAARGALRPSGALVQWLPLADIPVETVRSAVATFSSVFPHTTLFLPDNLELLLLGVPSDEPTDLARMRARLQLPEVAAELARGGYSDLESILSAAVAGPEDARAFGAGAELLTDDRPTMEFVSPRAAREHTSENERALLGACHRPLSGYRGAEALPAALADCRAARALTEAALLASAGRPADALPRFREAARLLPNAQRPLLSVRAATVTVAEAMVQQGQLDAAAQTYEAQLAEDPQASALWLNLGLVRARAGKKDQAREALERAQRDPAVATLAGRALSLLAP